MAANVLDSMDDRPQPGRLSEHAADELRPKVAAWTLLSAYLLLVRDLGEVDPADQVGRTGDGLAGGDEDLRADMIRMLRELHPHMVAGHAEDAVEVMTWIRPRWRAKVVRLVLAEAASWLTQSGYRPDHGIWFAGAASYLRAMAPSRHVEQALQLLDHESLLAEQDRVRALLAGRGAAAFSPDGVEHTVWYALAMRTHPVAAIHAAAALAAWVWAEPGAVTDPDQVAVELAERAMKFGQLAPPGDPASRREPVPVADDGDVFVPAWEQPVTLDFPALTEEALAALRDGHAGAFAAVIAKVGACGIQAMAHLIAMWAAYVHVGSSGSGLRERLDLPERETRWAARLAAVVDADTAHATHDTAVTAVRELPDQPDLWLLIWNLGHALYEMMTACGGLARLTAVHRLHGQVDQEGRFEDLAVHAIAAVAALSTGHEGQAWRYLRRAVTVHGRDTAPRLLVWGIFIAAGLKTGPGQFLITDDFVLSDPPDGDQDSSADPDAVRRMGVSLAGILTGIRTDGIGQAPHLFARHQRAFDEFGMLRLVWMLFATLGHHLGRVLPPV